MLSKTTVSQGTAAEKYKVQAITSQRIKYSLCIFTLFLNICIIFSLDQMKQLILSVLFLYA